MDVLLHYFDIVLPICLKILFLLIPLLLSVAYLTLMERKVIGWMQLRTGPSVVGFWGLLQPIADALKLLLKEPILPAKSNKILFILAPIITFTLAMVGWAVIPIDNFVIADVNVGVMYLLAVSSLGIYGIVIAGWASNSRYAFLGAIRSAAQMISYELAMSLCVIAVALTSGTLNLKELVIAQQSLPLYMELLLLPMFVIFFISILAETNRHPFDLSEADAEIVAGYNVEYASMQFALFFLGEYANMILTSAMATLLFLGGWFPPFGIECLSVIPGIAWFCLKVFLCLFVFIWIRAALPRYRYDQLMSLGWKILLPVAFFGVIVISCVKFIGVNH